MSLPVPGGSFSGRRGRCTATGHSPTSPNHNDRPTPIAASLPGDLSREIGAIAGNIADNDLATLNERSAEQLASLSGAVHDLVGFGPEATREGLAILRRCEMRLRRIAERAAVERGDTAPPSDVRRVRP